MSPSYLVGPYRPFKPDPGVLHGSRFQNLSLSKILTVRCASSRALCWRGMKSREVTPAAEEPLPLSHPTNQAVATESVTDQLSQRTARLRLEVRAAEEALLEEAVSSSAVLAERVARLEDELAAKGRELEAERSKVCQL